LLDVANEIFCSVTKNANFMLLETVQLAVKSNQICFNSNLGKVFQSPEFQAKLFFKANLSG